MASTSLTKPIRRRLSAFARGIAIPFNDSRRLNFITDMLTGLVAAWHFHLTAFALFISRTDEKVHAVDKRLSRQLASEHLNSAPVASDLLSRSA